MTGPNRLNCFDVYSSIKSTIVLQTSYSCSQQTLLNSMHRNAETRNVMLGGSGVLSFAAFAANIFL